MDCGANGCLTDPSTMSWVDISDRTIDMTGIANHTINALNIVHGATVVESDNGPCIQHYPESAGMKDGKTILSLIQMQDAGCVIKWEPKELADGEHPHVISPDGYRFPLYIEEGLAYMKMRPVRDDEWDSLPHTYMTKTEPWDPKKYDSDIDPNWVETLKDESKLEKKFQDLPFDQEGRMKDIEVDEPISVTSREVKIHLTKLVSDELCDLDFLGQTFEVDSESIDFGRMVFNMEQEHRYPTRNRKKVDYSEKRTRSRTVNPTPKSPTRVSRKGAKVNPRNGEPRDETSFDDDDYTEEELRHMRTGYNNPAKSTNLDEEGDVKVRFGPRSLKPTEENFPKLSRFFGGATQETIKKTLEATTQLGRIAATQGMKIYARRKAPNPALNIPRRNEPVATDTIYSHTPAVDNGSTAAQFFVGRKSGFCEAEGIGDSDKKFPTALMNHIRRYGAMDQLISDNAKAQLSDRVIEILNTFGIKEYMSEPHNKNQNYAERVWQRVKAMVERILNSSGAPPNCWLLALEYACFILNHTATESLNWRTPTEWLLGYTPDISALLMFNFWEPVFYKKLGGNTPDSTSELLGRFVGIADNVGNAVSVKILTESGKVITRAAVRTATKDGAFRNIPAEKSAPGLAPKEPNASLLLKDQTYPVIIGTNDTQEPPDESDEFYNSDEESEPNPGKTFLRSAMEEVVQNGGQLPTIDAQDILGRTFITTPDSDGEQRRAKVEDIEVTNDKSSDGREPLLRFKCSVGDKRFEEIMT